MTNAEDGVYIMERAPESVQWPSLKIKHGRLTQFHSELIYLSLMFFGQLSSLKTFNSLSNHVSTDALSTLHNAIQTRLSISYVTASNEPITTLSNASSLVLAPDLTLPKSSPTRLRKPGQTGTYLHKISTHSRRYLWRGTSGMPLLESIYAL